MPAHSTLSSVSKSPEQAVNARWRRAKRWRSGRFLTPFCDAAKNNLAPLTNPMDTGTARPRSKLRLHRFGASAQAIDSRHAFQCALFRFVKKRITPDPQEKKPP
jgi:hypothetical protein